MEPYQWVLLGIAIAWAPSLAALAFLLCCHPPAAEEHPAQYERRSHANLGERAREATHLAYEIRRP